MTARAFDVARGRLVPSDRGAAGPEPLAVLIHDQFRATVLSSAFPCLGGSGAVRRDDYAFALYPDIGSRPAIDACTADLAGFMARRPAEEHPVSIFVAAFAGPQLSDEARFERLLWDQLHGMRRREGAPPADPELYVDSDDPGFVFAGREFFVVGFSPASSRWARRFGWPVLAFNALTHVPPLRAAGKYERMSHRILERDLRLQGVENPSLHASQVAQFSGREVPDGWQPPDAGRRRA